MNEEKAWDLAMFLANAANNSADFEVVKKEVEPYIDFMDYNILCLFSYYCSVSESTDFYKKHKDFLLKVIERTKKVKLHFTAAIRYELINNLVLNSL